MNIMNDKIALSEAGKVYVENRAAVDLARQEADTYFAAVSKLVESRLGEVLLTGRLNWSVNLQWAGRGFHDYVAEFRADGAANTNLIAIRVHVKPDTRAAVQVGFWNAPATKAYLGANAGAIKNWRKELDRASDVETVPVKDSWAIAEAEVELALGEAEQDAARILKLAAAMMTAIERLLLGPDPAAG